MIRIRKKEISLDSPAFIIAEAAGNHMCDITLAKKMIDQAKKVAVDAIKFQTYKAERLVSGGAEVYWRNSCEARSQFEYYKKLDRFDRDDYKLLFEYAAEKEIIAFSTPFDLKSASMLNELGVPLFKIASCDLLNVRLIRHVAGFGRPMILSTGASTMAEVEQAVGTVFKAGNHDLILMVCTLSYPTDNQNANLKRIITFKERFPDIIIGLSDHTWPDENMVVPTVAVALGAKVIEKHYTLNRNMSGSGHSFAAEPQDFKKMVDNIRLTEIVLGNREIKVYATEEAARKNARKSLVASRDIETGERIVDDMIGVKRPGTGLSPGLIDQVIGKVAKFDIKQDSQITFEHLD